MSTPSTASLKLLVSPMAEGCRDLDARQLLGHLGQMPMNSNCIIFEARTRKAVVFRLPAAGHRVLVTLAGNDTYTVHHVAVRANKVKTLKTLEGIHCDMMHNLMLNFFVK